MQAPMTNESYVRLLIMTVLGFVAMYTLMYAMVNTFANVYASFNQFYMAGLMTAPMVLLELVLMGAMYHNKKWNTLIIGFSVIALIAFFVLVRQQTAISDEQFLRSMIPHHAGAILMCEKASIQDPEIVKLCQGILAGQQSEVDFMKAKLSELEN
ncbi:MAG: DUF305 domain-containing protein [Gammaproteobacteria bacterium]|nr:DUF305 domain-containing protein [Gammaproteobacteria bacterium]